MLDDAGLQKRAVETMGAFGGQLRGMPTSMPAMLGALLLSMSASRQIVIAGAPEDAGTEALARVARELATPETVLLYADGGAGQEWLGERIEFIRTVGPLDGKPAAYVCEDFACRLPVTDAEELRRELR
jgi:uncharacterized protein YyaL (SSP411 family)